MTTVSVVENIFGSSTEEPNIAGWQEEAAEKQKNNEIGGMKFISFFSLKPNEVGLVSFLNNGVEVYVHSVTEIVDGSQRFKEILCKRQNCELCLSGKPPRKQIAFGLIDWLHSYKAKTGEIVRKPTFKLFLKGLQTAQMLDKARKKQGKGTLVGKKWEITRLGSGTSTVYSLDIDADPFEIDFTVTTPFTKKDGSIVEIPTIACPQDWEAYGDLSLPENMRSMYSKNKMKPSTPLDLNDPASVKYWIQLHFLTTTQADYQKFAQYGKKKSSESTGVPLAEDDSTPF